MKFCVCPAWLFVYKKETANVRELQLGNKNCTAETMAYLCCKFFSENAQAVLVYQGHLEKYLF